MDAPRYTVITPSRGNRPRALALAIDSVRAAADSAGVSVEILVGFDGVRGERVRDYPFLRYVDFPRVGYFGNYIRDAFINVAKGTRLLFVDDDNAVTPDAFAIWERHLDAELVIGRIDVSRAFPDVGVLPRPGDPEPSAIIRPGNVDPLCLCLSADLVFRAGGWRDQGGYESDFVNIHRYQRRADSIEIIDDLVGVYDAGAGLDAGGMNPRQQQRRAT
ncbi:glycosyl transferase family 2 [Oceanidesulfovibrio marinus]|uniref:Glycosyltransferase family 2 protein n=1 Tax=Oceanidesulfovibrio marinus TaxID=370038 RepID=A0ABX6NC11_9BACT|nr:glycosyl transferase family 2 [Oceanidesulfovibrio marinus]QJT07613.1 glycosyltransferase family 2 protein [Oceanidesulfovibrio marinus]